MATQSQIEANRKNAQNSTGPKTEEGKQKSSRNRLSHGFASNTAELIRGEDPEEFQALLADLMDEHQPATPTEQLLVERMVITQWQIGRAFRLQNDCLTMRIQRTTTIPHDLGLFIRYQAAADRAFHKARTELVKAQKERKKSEIGFEPQTAVVEPETKLKAAAVNSITTDLPSAPIASIAQDAERTTKNTQEAPNSLKNAA